MRNRLAVAAGAISLVLVTLTPTVARAGVTTSCSFDAGTATVTATIGSGRAPTLIRNGSAIEFGGSTCGNATVTNTDQINIDAPDPNTDESLTVSEANGTFDPGKTPEADGTDEIEIAVTGLNNTSEQLRFVGTSGGDTFTVHSDGTDLLPGNAGEQEVTYPPAQNTKVVDADSGNDDVYMRGVSSSLVNGGGGDDTIAGSCFDASTYDGGPGTDTIDFSACDAAFGLIVDAFADGSATTLRDNGGVGTASDDLSSFETIIGTPVGDWFVGSAEPDHFIGGGGNDYFLPMGGDDRIQGGPGVDTLTAGASTGPVTFDLSTRVLTGEGTDRFASVESLQGSPHGDAFVGDPRASGIVFVDGFGGRDLLDLHDATRRQFVWTSTDGAVPGAPSWVRLVAQDIRRVRGSDLGDRIEVGSSRGRELRARFSGQGGDDLLVGGIHHDVLRGGAGDDTLNGKARRDVCYGGDGNNTYISC